MPGRTGLMSSASGAARMARRASRPPERRERFSGDGLSNISADKPIF
jgi:hypothetical protein